MANDQKSSVVFWHTQKEQLFSPVTISDSDKAHCGNVQKFVFLPKCHAWKCQTDCKLQDLEAREQKSVQTKNTMIRELIARALDVWQESPLQETPVHPKLIF